MPYLLMTLRRTASSLFWRLYRAARTADCMNNDMVLFLPLQYVQK